MSEDDDENVEISDEFRKSRMEVFWRLAKGLRPYTTDPENLTDEQVVLP